MQDNRRDGPVHARKHKFWDAVLIEAKRLLIIFLYLWVIFGLFVLHERIVLRQSGMTFTWRDGFAAINALALAKVMLVAEDLNLARWIKNGPLIYPILLESATIAIILLVFKIIEESIIGLLKHKALASSASEVGGGGVVGMICFVVIAFVVLIPFIAFRHVGRELGPGRLNAMLFGTRIPDDLPSAE